MGEVKNMSVENIKRYWKEAKTNDEPAGSSGAVAEELSLDEPDKVAGGSYSHCRNCPDRFI